MVGNSSSLNKRVYKNVVVYIPCESRWKPIEQDEELSTKILEKWIVVRQLNHSKRTMNQRSSPAYTDFLLDIFLKDSDMKIQSNSTFSL